MIEWMNWAFWTESLFGSLHFGSALLALGLGPIVLFRRKGDKPHRVLGTIWVISILIVNIIALSMYEMKGRPNLFHFFAVVSLISLAAGYISIWQFKRSRQPKFLNRHQHFMVWAYFGLAAAGTWQIVFKLVYTGQLDVSVGMLYNGLGALTAVIAISLNIFMMRKYPAPKKRA